MKYRRTARILHYTNSTIQCIIEKVNCKKAFKINKKTGKVTVKKGLKKGTYKIRVKVTAKGNKNYRPKTLTRTAKIRIK